jgi:hypothetical protein
MPFVLWCVPINFNTMRKHNVCNAVMLMRDLLLPTQVLCTMKQKGSLHYRHTPLVRVVSYPSRGYCNIYCPEDRGSEKYTCFPLLTRLSDGEMKMFEFKHTNIGPHVKPSNS